MSEKVSEVVSPIRLRVGIICFMLFWIPFWLVVPTISEVFNLDSTQVKYLTTVVLIIQTILGISGALIAGRSIVTLFKETKHRKLPGRVWHIVWTGKLD